MAAELTQQFGRYRILKKLGAGGMGTVYLAHDSEMDRPVALKVPQFDKRDQEEVIERFKREARIASRIRHPGICRIFDIGCIEGIHYLTMEFIEGTELASVVVDGKPWPAAKAIELTIRIAEALQALHQEGIVHRDLKPNNILLQSNGQPVLLDFGLARSVASQSQALASKSAAAGTPAYMAPEQWDGRADQIKAWTDVYALGIILFELLTGRRPFPGPSFVELFGQVTTAPRPRPSEFAQDIPPHLDQLCVEVLARDPAHRPVDMTQFIARLKQWEREPRTKQKHAGVMTNCPTCDKRIRIPETPGHKRVVCPGCRKPLPLDPLPKAVPLTRTEALTPIEPTLEETMATANLAPSRPTVANRRSSFRPVVVVPVLIATVAVVAIIVWMLLPPGGAASSSDSLLASQSTQGAKPTRPTPPKDKPNQPQPEPTFINSIGMRFSLIPAGKYQMGLSQADRARVEKENRDIGLKPEDDGIYLDWELPQHEVEITEPFYMGVYEVTQEEYETVMKKNPSHFQSGKGGGDKVKGLNTKRFPVDSISWNDATAFIDSLNQRPEEKQKDRLYRLPTEAEWEYACRGGKPGQLFHYGDKLTHAEANFETTFPFASIDKRLALGRPVAVDDPRYKPNAFGLYHMHGNVLEWCHDYFDGTYYSRSASQNPQGPPTPTPSRVLRGGSWMNHGWLCRSAQRFRNSPGNSTTNYGFRLVCVKAREG